MELSIIKEAALTTAKYVKRTHLTFFQSISNIYGINIHYKLENLQHTNSFKKRGSANKILSLSDEEKKRGVICASAGNHAQGVASTATSLGIKSQIVMPLNTPIVKIEKTKAYGGEVILFGENFDDSFKHAKEISDKDNITFIHPFDDEKIIAGQGVIGLEILEQLLDVDAVIIPIGGGGLIAGISSAIKQINPSVKIIGVQSENACAFKKSFDNSKLLTVRSKYSIAEGINVSTPGSMPLKIALKYVDRIETVSEKEIINAIKFLIDECRIVAEGAGAATTALLLSGKIDDFKGKNVVILVSGGNISSDKLKEIL